MDKDLIDKFNKSKRDGCSSYLSYGTNEDEYDGFNRVDPSPADILFLRIKNAIPSENINKKIGIEEAYGCLLTYSKLVHENCFIYHLKPVDKVYLEKANFDPFEAFGLKKLVDIIHSSQLPKEEYIKNAIWDISLEEAITLANSAETIPIDETSQIYTTVKKNYQNEIEEFRKFKENSSFKGAETMDLPF